MFVPDTYGMNWKSKISQTWEGYKKEITFGATFIVVLTIIGTKGCDLVDRKWSAPDRKFNFEVSECIEAEILDGGSGKELWNCEIKMSNHTGDIRILPIECSVKEPSNFHETARVLKRGGGISNSPLCFDTQNTFSKKCSQTLQKDEFVSLSFQVASYEKPIVNCNSDSF